MGNNSSRESRGPGSPSSPTSQTQPTSPSIINSANNQQQSRHVYGRSNGRGSRPDLSFLGIGSSSNNEIPERRETKQEREARKLEKERIARVKERERSIKEEHVDGGFLVTMGVYTGTEDFSKPVVRQLMIERRIAPFWRGLNDFKEEWTEHQLVAAGRGLPIPAADEIPSEDLTRPLSSDSPNTSNQNLQKLLVPISARTQSAQSETSANLSPSHPAFNLPSPSSPLTPPPAAPSSPFRPRSKTLASLTKSTASTEMVPREVQLPKDPYVNGQLIETFQYKNAEECPICFLCYPPYLNKTRCCDQPICSECFVQIKRPDPHPPEHVDPSTPAPPPENQAEAEQLVSEPAACPYCQQSEFGVIYEPPPFRRGLAYANAAHGLGSFSSAMSSSSSLGSTGNPIAPPQAHKRRTTSISANASTVITTDRVRPEWVTKLANARNHVARRSAAATALHTAAYLIGNGNDTRSFSFGGRSRFGRNRAVDSPGGMSTGEPSPIDPGARDDSDHLTFHESPGASGTARRSRVEDLEEMMMMEAIRQSLAAEEERTRKAEKEAAKTEKKKVKEEKKQEKKQEKKEKKERKSVYGSGASSASGSSALSLSLPGIGRRRNNSGGSNLAREATPENEESHDVKGKGVDRGLGNDYFRTGNTGSSDGRHLDPTFSNTAETHQGTSPPTAPDRPSHLRNVSNASSPGSSFIDSVPGSMRNGHHGHGSSSSYDSANVSRTNISGQGGSTSEGGDADGNASGDLLPNYHSLAQMIESSDGDENTASHKGHQEPKDQGTRATSSADLGESVTTLKDNSHLGTLNSHAAEGGRTTLLESQSTTPEVMITPVTPAAATPGDQDSKQLGRGWSEEQTTEITQ